MSSEPPHPLGSPTLGSLDGVDGDAMHAHPQYQESLKFLAEVKVGILSSLIL